MSLETTGAVLACPQAAPQLLGSFCVALESENPGVPCLVWPQQNAHFIPQPSFIWGVYMMLCLDFESGLGNPRSTLS